MTTKDEHTADEELSNSTEQNLSAGTDVDAATSTDDLAYETRARHAMPMDETTMPVASVPLVQTLRESKPAHASHDFWGSDASSAATPAQPQHAATTVPTTAVPATPATTEVTPAATVAPTVAPTVTSTDAPSTAPATPAPAPAVAQTQTVAPAPESVPSPTADESDPGATTNLWATTPTVEPLQQLHTSSARAELLSLPELESSATAGPAVTNDVLDDHVEAQPLEEAEIVDAPQKPFEVEATPTPQKSGTGRKVLKIVGITAGALLAVYVGGSVFFMSHFMPNTRVNGDDVSLKSVDDLAAHVTSTGESYSTHVTGDGLDLTINAGDIELGYDGAAYGAEAQAQIDPWKWPAIIWNEHDFHMSTGITFNQDKLNLLVTSAVDAINANSQPPTNATMMFDEKKAMFVSVPDALGTMVDRDNSIAAVSEGVRTLQDTIELKEPQLAQPAVRVDDERLARVIDESNQIVKLAIPLRIAGRDALTIDANLIKNWIHTNEHCELIVDTEAIKGWTQGDLSKNFDSVGSTRVYTRPDGKQVSVSGGDYGWNLDGEQLADMVAAYLLNKNSNPLEVPMKSQAAQWNPGGPDWGPRYIDVDMAEQYVRVYDESGQIVLESDCVTGVPYHATDEGVYTIYEHTPNMTLVGLDYNGDGQPDYQTPVSYWMPFNGGQGLHDAYWRGAFGGNIYEYDGSHGCVNLPSDVAAQLFDWSHVGDVVVVHW